MRMRIYVPAAVVRFKLPSLSRDYHKPLQTCILLGQSSPHFFSSLSCMSDFKKNKLIVAYFYIRSLYL